ncbi:metal-dependent hydrolase [Vibrio alginolyticus]|uniref:metal-dependent hydrolase n=1 Tax=Vibrio alginolyticus TaxID=663 RepID=UPI002FF3483F|nr:metal-dependent hydrolase [Vibrio parahaemolyticus]
MNRLGHVAGAIAFSPVAILPVWDTNPLLTPLCAMGLIIGSNAPDWLEFGVIPHRTFTHILSIWLCIALYGLLSLIGLPYIEMTPFTPARPELAALLAGFGCGGISHWLGDVLNMRPVPIVTPFDKIALRLFNSGTNQSFTCLFIFLVSLALTDVVTV